MIKPKCPLPGPVPGSSQDPCLDPSRDPCLGPSARPCLRAIYRYPVKGLTPEALERAALAPGDTLPFDRAYAIEHAGGRFEEASPRHLPKTNFLMLMRNERLATLRSKFEDDTETLTLSRDGKPVARGRLSTPLGRRLIEQFIAAYMQRE